MAPWQVWYRPTDFRDLRPERRGPLARLPRGAAIQSAGSLAQVARVHRPLSTVSNTSEYRRTASLIAVERVVPGGAEPFLGRRLDATGRGQPDRRCARGQAGFHRRKQLRLDAMSTTAFKSAPEKSRVSCRDLARSRCRRPACPGKACAECVPPAISGGGTNTIRSKRPGRRNAMSRCQGAFVAARISTPSFDKFTPSSSERNWLIKCRPARCRMSVRLAPMASTSSKNRTQGQIAPRLLENRVQLLFAVADVHVEHVVDANRQEAGLHLAGRGPGQMGLAAARRTVHQNAATDRLAIGFVKLGMLERMNDFEADLFLHPSMPPTSLKATAAVRSRRQRPGRRFRRPQPACRPCSSTSASSSKGVGRGKSPSCAARSSSVADGSRPALRDIDGRPDRARRRGRADGHAADMPAAGHRPR